MIVSLTPACREAVGQFLLPSGPKGAEHVRGASRKSVSSLYCPVCGSPVGPGYKADVPGYACGACGRHVVPRTLKQLWDDFSDTPVNDNDDTEAAFMCFPAGTDRFEIWHWFEERCPVSLYTDLMYPEECL